MKGKQTLAVGNGYHMWIRIEEGFHFLVHETKIAILHKMIKREQPLAVRHFVRIWKCLEDKLELVTVKATGNTHQVER